MLRLLKIGSRKSALAKLQSYLTADALRKIFPELEIQFYFKESTGDKDLTSPLWKMGDRGVFTKDFKEDLLNETVDVVIHSWKDLDLQEDNTTEILSILDRADQRDLLLFKKDAFLNPNFDTIKIFSSSPRREYNLTKFLAKAFPKRLQNKPIQFEPVRGNMQTRMNKWMAEPGAQGLILAKAALDRLLAEDFPESKLEEYAAIRTLIRGYLDKSLLMVLPLSENPNAPAQGALAAEVKSSRKDVLEIIKKLTIPSVSSAVLTERKELKKYGGGCHQKIGVAVLEREYGSVFFLKGKTDDGKELNEEKILKEIKQPKAKSKEDIFPLKGSAIHFDRVAIPAELPDANLFIARKDAWHPDWKNPNADRILWAAGLKTLTSLAEKDFWVSGTSESLGENEPIGLEFLLNNKKPFVKVTHDKSEEIESKYERVFTYSLKPAKEIPDLSKKTHFFWMSGYQFDLCAEKYPTILDSYHSCGPGITANHILKKLKDPSKLEVFLNYESWLEFHG